MARFLLRVWAEQTLFDCRDYEVEAPTLEEAVELLQEQQDEADCRCGDAAFTHPAIDGDFKALDPEEIVGGASGVTLIDETGDRVRDLISVPTGCVQLGEPIA